MVESLMRTQPPNSSASLASLCSAKKPRHLIGARCEREGCAEAFHIGPCKFPDWLYLRLPSAVVLEIENRQAQKNVDYQRSLPQTVAEP